MTTLRLIDGQDQAAARGATVPRSADAHHQLGEYHAYAAIAALMGGEVAADETGAPIQVHAARLAAALGELLAENAVLRVIAAEVLR